MSVSLAAFVLENHPALRTALVSGLRSSGFSRVDTTTDRDEALRAMETSLYDLVLFDTSKNLTEISATIRTARQNLSDHDPFGFYLMTGPAPSVQGVEHIVSSGCDAFLVRPFSRDLMQKRLSRLIDNNRPFVVTTHYIGPDRRKAVREETFTRRVMVPNTLKAKKAGNFDPEAHREALDRALLTFNTYLVERQAYLIELLEEGGNPGIEEELTRSENNILITVKKLAGSLETAGQNRLQPIVTAISETAAQRIKRNEHLGAKSARELQKLCVNLANFVSGVDYP